MKRLILAVGLLLTASGARQGWAHDGGHGPKLMDVGQQGGTVSPVIDIKDYKKGVKAAIVYKAELVRAEDGNVSVYFYDKDMKPLDTARFGETAKGMVENVRKGKVTKKPFTLKAEGGAFVGAAPAAPYKPFNIDVTLKEGDRDLLVAFDNLD